MATAEPYFTCGCAVTAKSGPTCSISGCGLGFYETMETCQRCRCDPRGVADDVCDRDTGDCVCKVRTPGSGQEGGREGGREEEREGGSLYCDRGTVNCLGPSKRDTIN